MRLVLAKKGEAVGPGSGPQPPALVGSALLLDKPSEVLRDCVLDKKSNSVLPSALYHEVRIRNGAVVVHLELAGFDHLAQDVRGALVRLLLATHGLQLGSHGVELADLLL